MMSGNEVGPSENTCVTELTEDFPRFLGQLGEKKTLQERRNLRFTLVRHSEVLWLVEWREQNDCLP